MGWLTGYGNRKQVNLTGQSGSGTLYQVVLSIGDSAGGDFHLEGNCQGFPNDIRFTDNDGDTELNYFIEDVTADPIKVWIKVADDLGSNQAIYVYYNKAADTTTSSGLGTYELFDDFTSDQGWTEDDAFGLINLDVTTDYRLEYTNLGNNRTAFISRDYGGVSDFALEYTENASGNSDNARFGLADSLSGRLNAVPPYDSIQGIYNTYASPANIRLFLWEDATPSATIVTNVTEGNTYYMTITKDGTVVTMYVYSDSTRSTLVDSLVDAYNGNADFINKIFLGTGDATGYMQTGWIDDVRIRKFHDAEPAWASTGAEESEGGAAPGITNMAQKLMARGMI